MWNFAPGRRFPKSVAAIFVSLRRSLPTVCEMRRISSEPPSYPPPEQHLLNGAMRPAAELDEARLFRAAAHASMAADAIRSDAGYPQVEDRRPDIDLNRDS